MTNSFEYVQHPRRALPPPIPTGRGPAAAFLPGTFHPINPKQIAPGSDQVLLSGWGKFLRWLLVLASIFAIIVGINLILDGVYNVGTTSTNRLYDLARDPFIGLLIGILTTALVQSSTTTTTLTVAAVGTGIVTVPVAIPIIMGANIGTTITALLVSFSYMGERREFKKAFTTAAMHLWFNVLVVLVALTIEMLFHPLQTISGDLADKVLGSSETTVPTTHIVEDITTPIVDTIGTHGLFGMVGNGGVATALSLITGTLFILVAIKVMSYQLRMITAATTHSLLDMFSSPEENTRLTLKANTLGVGVGLLFTIMVTASSVTVSSMQPFAVTKSLPRRAMLAVILGANVGTTLTAMIATFAIVGVHGAFALQAALVHLTLNLVGALVVLCVPSLGRAITNLAAGSARLAARSYTRTIVTIFGMFMVFPIIILVIYALMN
ncbi:Na/Pi symporter [uncultured Corynebacterium sp.]|uniref:Na/Pi symporter n=1 Tax=uncultured Corynebacterium sp. TaxID=159447 RepID=UPI0025EDCF46|nr:Na/Pi symporter [uncultured Corynebacterium sp.]